jgi:hypothetical protein
MATTSRIIIPTNTYVGSKLLSLAAQIIAAQQMSTLLVALVNDITGGGATPTNLEVGTDVNSEALFPVGSGGALYSGIVGLNTSLNSLMATVSNIARN